VGPALARQEARELGRSGSRFHGQARALPWRRHGRRSQARPPADHDRPPAGQRFLPPVPGGQLASMRRW
jgi:hypothetical protein